MQLIICPKKVGEKAFALEINGDSMSPDYNQDPDVEYRSGDPCVILEGDEATFKIFRQEASTCYLVPLNKRYPIKEFKGADREKSLTGL